LISSQHKKNNYIANNTITGEKTNIEQEIEKLQEAQDFYQQNDNEKSQKKTKTNYQYGSQQ
jgi:hypothetical protein